MRLNRYKSHSLLIILACGVCTALGMPRTARAQATRPAQTTSPTVNGEPVVHAAPANERVIDLTVGQSRMVDSAWPVKRVSLADPTIADVDVSSPRRIQLQGKSVGSTEITIWSETGEIWQARLVVGADVSRLQGQLRKLFADSNLEVTQADDVLVIGGTLAKAQDAVHLRQLLQMANLKYLDRTSVAGLQQVQLQVKVAEVSRSSIRLLGINAVYGGEQFFGGLQLGSSAGPFTPMNIGLPSGTVINGPTSAGRGSNLPFAVGDGGISVPQAATLFAGFPNSDLQVFLQALAENQYLRVLAEPTLVARSGQEAQFLAGGEFPIPIAQLGGGGTTQISIEYKEFGVRLRFTPTVLGNGTIQLKVAPEVSQLSDVGAVSVLGTRVPSVLSRRVETTLDLQSGQTFAIAGLINQTDSSRSSRIPVLGDMPVLGPLFRSIRYDRNDTELLVLVTASLAAPSSNDLNPPAPGSFHEEPNDWELYIEGRLEGKSHVRLSPAQQERLKRLGLDGLKGPGAWATYDGQPNHLAGQESTAN